MISGRYSKCIVSKKNHFPPQTNPCLSNALTIARGGIQRCPYGMVHQSGTLFIAHCQ